jgi:hypothetical protein
MGRALYAYRIQKSSVVSTLHARHNSRHENNSAVSVNNLNDLARDASCQTAGHFLEFLEQDSFNRVALLASDDSHWLTGEQLLAGSARTCAGGATPSSGTRFAWRGSAVPLRFQRPHSVLAPQEVWGCGRAAVRKAPQ